MFKKKSTPSLAETPKVPGQPTLAEVVQQARGVKAFEDMVTGHTFARMQKGKSKDCELRLDPSAHQLLLGDKERVDVTRMLEVRSGFATQEFLRHGAESNLDESRTISLVYHTGAAEPEVLNLVAPDEATCKWWLEALRVLLDKINANTGDAYLLVQPWVSHLLPGKDTMSCKTAIELMESLNLKVQVNEKQMRDIIKQFDENGDERLDFGEFVRTMRALRSHPAVTALFKTYASADTGLLSVAQLVQFAAAEQQQTLTAAQAKGLIRKYSFGKDALTEEGFQFLMAGMENDAFDPARKRVYQDMTRPMNEYHVATSHNTYLTGDQLKSDSSIEMYVRALEMGCRCVEIDVWDGPGGEPIVYHGHTLTSKILFADVLRVVKSHGFTASPYPIILSLETHCKSRGQEQMAKLLDAILGDMLIREKEGGLDVLPSPDALQYKVLVKGKSRVSPTQEEEGDDEAAMTVADELDMRLVMGGSSTALQAGSQSISRSEGSEVILTELERLTYFKATACKNFAVIANWQAYQMASFSEGKTFKTLEKGDEGLNMFRKYTSKFLARIYPKGTRVDSSNYDPVLPWLAGCQLVALNYQTCTVPMQVNFAKFLDNGLAGYNLRSLDAKMNAPDAAAGERFSRPQTKVASIKVTVLGARLLPRTGKLAIVDPFVVAQIHDGSAKPVRSRTERIMDNGFNPNWNHTCELAVRDSSSAFLLLDVWDDQANCVVGHWAAPVDGYRVCTLLDSNFRPIRRGMCHLLVKIEVK